MGMNNKFVLILKKDKEYDIKQIESNLIKAFKKLEITDKVNLNIVYLENIDYNYLKDIKLRDKLTNSFEENIVDNLEFNLKNNKESIYNLIFVDNDIMSLIIDYNDIFNSIFNDERIKYIYYSNYNRSELNPDFISFYYLDNYPGKFKCVIILNNKILVNNESSRINLDDYFDFHDECFKYMTIHTSSRREPAVYVSIG